MLARCSLVVQMLAKHGVKRNSPHDALLQGAYRQTRPEAKIYGKTLENTYSETPGGSGGPSGGPRKAASGSPCRGPPRTCPVQTLCSLLARCSNACKSWGQTQFSPSCAFAGGVSPGAPRSEIVWKTLEKLHILRPREAPGGLQEGPGRPPGGPRGAPRSIPRLHMSAKGLQEFRRFRFPHVSPTKNANSEARRCSNCNSFTFSRGKCKKVNRGQPRRTAKPE